MAKNKIPNFQKKYGMYLWQKFVTVIEANEMYCSKGLSVTCSNLHQCKQFLQLVTGTGSRYVLMYLIIDLIGTYLLPPPSVFFKTIFCLDSALFMKLKLLRIQETQPYFPESTELHLYICGLFSYLCEQRSPKPFQNFQCFHAVDRMISQFLCLMQ